MIDFFNELMARFSPVADALRFAQNDLLLFLSLIQFLFILLCFIILIFLTHKVAGPMHKLKNHLADIRQGKEITLLTFRKGDHFQDVAEEVSLFLQTIAQNQENDFEYLDQVASYIENIAPVVPDDKKPVLTEITRQLNLIKSRYKKNL